ncbi:DUF6236 family protein [Micromonospora narathiwatensis]|nr:DUF6236 family protein [Micromonospora narathiwatensis]
MLYYPFSNAPLPVLYQAVLYWDDLATVVASGWQNRVNDRMREVHDAGLYRPIEPYEDFEPIEIGAIEAELNHALDSMPLDDLMPPSSNIDERTNILHLEKIHGSVADELRRHRLVREVPGAPWRLIGSPALVHVVVSVVAEQIARQANERVGFTSEIGLRPHTDMSIAHRLGLEPISGQMATPGWRVDIGQLLPVPAGDVMLSDLLRFRKDYDHERRRMMRAIDDLLMQLSHGQHPADVFRSVKQELAEATEELHAAAGARWKVWSRRAIGVTVATGGAYVGGAASGTSGAITAGLAVLSGVMINVATDTIRGTQAGDSGWQRYRYLHRVQRKLGAIAGGRLR